MKHKQMSKDFRYSTAKLKMQAEWFDWGEFMIVNASTDVQN